MARTRDIRKEIDALQVDATEESRLRLLITQLKSKATRLPDGDNTVYLMRSWSTNGIIRMKVHLKSNVGRVQLDPSSLHSSGDKFRIGGGWLWATLEEAQRMCEIRRRLAILQAERRLEKLQAMTFPAPKRLSKNYA
jgi:hypothetical protein